jgi:hypothetical protein
VDQEMAMVWYSLFSYTCSIIIFLGAGRERKLLVEFGASWVEACSLDYYLHALINVNKEDASVLFLGSYL